LGNNQKEKSTQKWQAVAVEFWQGKYLNQQTVKLPILNLERESMAAWVNVMVGKGTSWCAGAGLGSELMVSEPEEEEEEEEPLTPREQINNFYATSSKEAWQLIQYLSAIPVSLSTIRLVQRTLLPKSTQVNVAEVLMGGLLSPVKPFNSYRFPHQIEFEFQPGIRDIFLDRLGGEEFCIGVIGSLTEKIASHFGYETIREFEATLLNEPWNFQDDKDIGLEDIRLIQTFATISVSTLRQYGKKYGAYIPKLDRSRAKLYLMSEVPGESINWIDFLENVAQEYHLSSIQTETLIHLFPSSQEFLSISEVAQKLLSSTSAIRGRLTNIFRKFETKNPDLFESRKGSKLEALQFFLSSQYVNSYIPQTLENDEIEEELQEWSFDTPTVDQRGEILHRKTYSVSYFSEIIADGISLEMVLIPGGTFTMGSPESEERSGDNERPQHDVTVPSFFMAKYPVTQGQWREIASRTDLKVKLDLDPEPSNFQKPYQGIDRWERPVEFVNWYEAAEFCKRLSKLRGRNYRLPSEAEWEYACRAGTTTPFYFGETITPELVNYDGNYTYGDGPKGKCREQTTPVGQFPPNAFGLYDMHGNVREWCADEWHKNYQNAPTDGIIWLNRNKDRSPLRGGSWANSPKCCRSAFRFLYVRRDVHSVNAGFRVVCYVNSYIPPTFEDHEFELGEELQESSFEAFTVEQEAPTIEQEVSTVKQFEEELQDWNFEAPTVAVDQLEEELQEWSFEASTVDQRGGIIYRRPYTASYFSEIIADGISLEMVLIPGGTFTMGSPESEEGSRHNEWPQHDVTVPSFFMAKYPVTQGQWKAIASRTDLKVNLDLEPEPSRFKKPYQDIDRWQRPVERVNSYEAAEFCKRLSKLRGRNYRLPSEAEWEYACRAGTTTPFYFGETITPELVNYNGNYSYGDGPKGEYREQTTPVGQFPPNAFGLYDMHGNVWEWSTDDRHDNYVGAPTDGSAWVDIMMYKITTKNYTRLRGGSWDYDPTNCRSAIRSSYNWRDDRYNNTGFRVVWDGGRTL
jgi:formylglycine-generating enzyme required for sulfatase activity